VVWPDAEPEKERRQKTPADVAFVFRGAFSSEADRLHRDAKQYPAGWKDSGGVYGLKGMSRMRILASALGPA
jgi:hypothetical protein